MLNIDKNFLWMIIITLWYTATISIMAAVIYIPLHFVKFQNLIFRKTSNKQNIIFNILLSIIFNICFVHFTNTGKDCFNFIAAYIAHMHIFAVYVHLNILYLFSDFLIEAFGYNVAIIITVMFACAITVISYIIARYALLNNKKTSVLLALLSGIISCLLMLLPYGNNFVFLFFSTIVATAISTTYNIFSLTKKECYGK